FKVYQSALDGSGLTSQTFTAPWIGQPFGLSPDLIGWVEKEPAESINNATNSLFYSCALDGTGKKLELKVGTQQATVSTEWPATHLIKRGGWLYFTLGVGYVSRARVP
ncbi:MAG: hypothetical protein H6Q89_4903, partial [Myxococcaceae bacterium]|nr:hypothetical protein [Myxococcaceae bacterium]